MAQIKYFYFIPPNIFIRFFEKNYFQPIKTLVMTGKVLQERIAAVTDIPFNIIAEKIGVSAQSMYQFFTAKDVKSGLIEKVCEVLNIDVATLYGQEQAQGINHNAGDVITGNNIANRVDPLASCSEYLCSLLLHHINRAAQRLSDGLQGVKPHRVTPLLNPYDMALYKPCPFCEFRL